jgi:triacylglycerol lipase
VDASPAVTALCEGVRKLGARFDDAVLQATRELYAPHLAPLPPGCSTQRDVAYGPDARHRLDLYLPPGGGTRAAPLLLYVPGGGFVGGDKDLGDGFYANVGGLFAGAGFATAVMNHRLAPAHAWPAGSDDVAAAVAWLAANGQAHGADAGRLCAIGQSAGATHLAGVLFDARFAAAARHVRAGVLMSGLYDAQAPLRPGPLAYFGPDAATYAERSPLRQARPGHARVLLALAELDPAGMARQTLQLADRLAEVDGHCPPLAWLEGHNHVSTVFSLGTAQDDVARVLLDFLRRGVG